MGFEQGRERQTVTPYIWLTYDALTDSELRRALTHDEGPLLRGGSKYPQFGKYRNLPGTPRRKGGLVLWVPFPKGNLGGGHGVSRPMALAYPGAALFIGTLVQ